MDPEQGNDGSNRMSEEDFDAQFRESSEELLDGTEIKGMGRKALSDRLGHIHHHAHGLRNKLPGPHKFRLNTAFSGLYRAWGNTDEQRTRLDSLKELVESYSGEKIHAGP